MKQNTLLIYRTATTDNASTPNIPNKKNKSRNSNEEEEQSPIDFFKLRSASVVELKQNAETHPYPHKLHVTTSLHDFVNKYECLKKDEHLNDEQVTVAGRIHSIRRASSKLLFYDLRGEGTKLQVMANSRKYESLENFEKDANKIRRGDIVGITGIPARSSSGELSIIPINVRFLRSIKMYC